MILINIALIILGVLYGVGLVTNFTMWKYQRDYLSISLNTFTVLLLISSGILNILG